MCPDHQILSVYVDGELPSPWKEKMEAHLASCPQCVERIAALRRLTLHSGDDEALEAALGAAQERVWQRLSRLEPATGVAWKQRPGIWRRRVSVPLPAVVAAAAALVVAATLMLTQQTAPQTSDTMTVAQSPQSITVPVVPVSTLNEVLQYLDNQDATDIMLIRLPESKSFSSSGEPALIKAADYSRSKNTQ
ncbi:MAG: zf-HC2 domain-containing protein [Treponema sp.]|jgi:anti-sigma factor RsiW|nr:zf-HC2 domain-containing protein [Treponema sp.]